MVDTQQIDKLADDILTASRFLQIEQDEQIETDPDEIHRLKEEIANKCREIIKIAELRD